jgi:DNA-binding NarL/FixJ family response regulator
MEPRLRVVVVASDPLARNGLAALLASADDLEIVAEVDLEARLAADAVPIDAVVVDLGTESADLEAVPAVALGPTIALSPTVEQGRALLGVARAVLLRDADGERLRAAVRAVASGLYAMDEPLFAALASRNERLPMAEATPALTPRELEVLGLLGEGLSNKLIAARLSISENTVKFHVNAIFDKLSADTRTEAVTRGLRLGLLML